MGFVSRPDLGTMLAEQLGVELAKQEGFGAGLWSEIKRRHPRGRPRTEEDETPEPVGLLREQELPLAPITSLTSTARPSPTSSRAFGSSWPSRRHGSRRSARLTRERSACSRSPAGSWQAGPKRSTIGASGPCARRTRQRTRRRPRTWPELEATAAELRAELIAREQELAERNASETLVQSLSEQVEALRVESDEAWGLFEGARTEARALDGTVTALRAELEAREEALNVLRDEHAGSKDAIAALTTQVDELRAGTEELEMKLEESRAQLGARDDELAAGAEVKTQLAAEATRREEELKALRDEHAGSKDAIAALTIQVDELRAGALDSQRLLDKERSESQAAVAALTEGSRKPGPGRRRSRPPSRSSAKSSRARGDARELEQELSAVREEMARLEQVSDKRKAKVKELQGLLEDQRVRSAAATADLELQVAAAQDKAGGLEQLIAEGEQGLSRAAEARSALEAELAELRRQAPHASELEQELSAVRDEDGSPGADLGEAKGQGQGASGSARGRASPICRRGSRARAAADDDTRRGGALGAAARRARAGSGPRGRGTRGSRAPAGYARPARRGTRPCAFRRSAPRM